MSRATSRGEIGTVEGGSDGWDGSPHVGKARGWSVGSDSGCLWDPPAVGPNGRRDASRRCCWLLLLGRETFWHSAALGRGKINYDGPFRSFFFI